MRDIGYIIHNRTILTSVARGILRNMEQSTVFPFFFSARALARPSIQHFFPFLASALLSQHIYACIYFRERNSNDWLTHMCVSCELHFCSRVLLIHMKRKFCLYNIIIYTGVDRETRCRRVAPAVEAQITRGVVCKSWRKLRRPDVVVVVRRRQARLEARLLAEQLEILGYRPRGGYRFAPKCFMEAGLLLPASRHRRRPPDTNQVSLRVFRRNLNY